MRVLVCGGRNFDEWRTMAKTLDMLHAATPFTLVIHGDARGADRMAGKWAGTRGIPVAVFPAQWNRYGKRAGHLRNAAMLEHGKPDQVVAFPGGRGTADMVAKAAAANVPFMEVSRA